MAETTQSSFDTEERLARPLPPYVPRLAFAGGLVLTGVVLIMTVGVHRPGGEEPPPPAAPQPVLAVPDQKPQPGVATPRAGLAAPPDRPTVSDAAELETWAKRVAAKTKLPVADLSAYGRAEMWLRRQKPGCHLSWATLAGVSHVETAQGRPGPITLAPDVWAKHSMRATGDGKRPDPENLDDAALATARYLCADGDDIATPVGWWKAMRVFNPAVPYIQEVFSAADAYADASVAP
ncbi:murein transglycosylase [Amycolatopsis orientalis]|uniref:Murein transglycosylase n=1 Tax=Amycolatopsis orientalis TaxID=31958 RepID=A0A193BSQ7_AMYOR|nr:murein transglycosylase [Amycolatopsis orientalis]ANN15213.1 murein transglycosylase [Amycolatopsis orientalis]